MKKTLSIAAASIFLMACGERKVENIIQIDGSSTVFPLTEAVAEEFRTVHPRVPVTIGVSGTGGGFQKFCRDEIHIANASRPIKEDEVGMCGKNAVDYLELKVAYDGLAVVVNPENNWVDQLTLEELKLIWEPEAQSKIMRWNQIRPEWPNEEIHLFGPGIASGTYDYFTEAVVGESGSSRGDFTASEDDNVLVQGIAGDKYALGFFGLAYYEENQQKLKLIGVHNGETVVKPSIQTVSDGTYHPLSRPLLVYVNKNSLETTEVVEFVDFYLQEAAGLSKEIGYVPLPAEEYQEQIEKFEAFKKKLPAKKQ